MESYSFCLNTSVVLFFIPLLNSCSYLPDSGDRALADSTLCYKMIGQGNIARLNGEYAKSNQIYLTSLAAEECKNLTLSPGMQNPNDNITFIADNYQALGDDKDAIIYYDKSPQKGRKDVQYSRLISIGHSEPTKRASVIHEINTNYKGNEDVRFYDLRYLNGERTTDLLKLYLGTIDNKLSGQSALTNFSGLDYYNLLIHSTDYNNPIKLATELNQIKVAAALRKQQQDIIAIENKALAQNIPGPGTSSGQPELLARRGAFYAQAYREIGLTTLADIYKRSYETSQNDAITVANQRAIDQQDAVNKAAEDSAQTQANIQMFSSLLTNMSTTYAATHSNSGTGGPLAPTTALSSGQMSNPGSSGINEKCDYSTVSGFSHCCLAIRHGSIRTYPRKDGFVDYACKSPSGDVQACTYSGPNLVSGVEACGVQ